MCVYFAFIVVENETLFVVCKTKMHNIYIAFILHGQRRNAVSGYWAFGEYA